MLSQSLARTKPGENNRNAAANRLALFEPAALAQEKQRRLILPGEMGHVRALEINLSRAPGGADFEHREFAQPIEEDHATGAVTDPLLGIYDFASQTPR